MNRHPNPWIRTRTLPSAPIHLHTHLQNHRLQKTLFLLRHIQSQCAASRKSFTFSTYDSSQKTVWNLCTWGIALFDRHTFRGCLATCHKGLAVGICSVLCKSANHTTPGAPAFSDLLRAIPGIAYTADTDRSGWLLRFWHCTAARTHSVEGNWRRIFYRLFVSGIWACKGSRHGTVAFLFSTTSGTVSDAQSKRCRVAPFS